MSGHDITILAIEDELPIRRFLKAYLDGRGFRLLEAGTGQEGLSLAASHRPDVILLDLGLPDMDGLDVLARLREWTKTPIIILSAREQEQDKIRGLDAGADDYLGKPFGLGELEARMRVALRHAEASARDTDAGEVFESGDLRVDLARRKVTVAGEEARLTPIEFKLLAAMVRHAGLVVTHAQLLREVWGRHDADQAHYVRIYVHQLRGKIEREPARPEHLKTETGVGYRLE
ncbi:two component transcriptional regulator, winged helix family [Desulfovibrio sp. X2]|uniref:response regulator n=1 Tax=Desulfovibrio sp. X2 TaxID=941449 RepID=UPI000358E7BC|nr:response regulator [Desulfovibrio sp. X2]EPR43465.1 two component transcriptional regulator, winged helix family [Desulfovibrio sp. X2]